MRTIAQDTLEAIEKTHPIEAAIWNNWVATGQAQIVKNTENEGLKCMAIV